MEAKKFLIATVAGGATLFVTGGVLYGLLLADFMDANSAAGLMKEQPDFSLLVLGELVFAAFLTLVLPRWSGIDSFMDGAKAGAILGLLFALGLNLILYSTMNLMEAVAIPVDTLANMVRMSLACGVIAAVLSRK